MLGGYAGDKNKDNNDRWKEVDHVSEHQKLPSLHQKRRFRDSKTSKTPGSDGDLRAKKKFFHHE